MNLTSLIRDEFVKHEIMTLQELYDVLNSHPDVTLEGSTLKHRIRNVIYHLKKIRCSSTEFIYHILKFIKIIH